MTKTSRVLRVFLFACRLLLRGGVAPGRPRGVLTTAGGPPERPPLAPPPGPPEEKVRRRLQDDARELLCVPQERRTPVPPPRAPAGDIAIDDQFRPGRHLATVGSRSGTVSTRCVRGGGRGVSDAARDRMPRLSPRPRQDRKNARRSALIWSLRVAVSPCD